MSHPDFFILKELEAIGPMFETLNGKSLDRRTFLRGSALFAAAIGVSVLPVAAQQPQPQQPKPEEEEKPKKEEEPKDPFADPNKKEEKKLYDAEGREYRVCPQCAYNMYKQGRMWVCENCGYSYVE
jgi:ribosomal protein L12E/L44/L45/RPP1/RPP2